MTIRELKEEVEALGFSGLSTDERSLICTVNRALKMIHTAHPKKKRVELGFFPEEAILHREAMVGEGAEVSLSVPAGHLTMMLQGEGQYTMRYGKSSITRSFSCISTRVDFTFPEEGELVFSRESNFSAWDISMYKRSAFPYEDAVYASGDYLSVDLKKLFSDLIYLLEDPSDYNGREIRGSFMQDTSHLMLPRSYRGVIRLTYRAAAEEITMDNEDDDKIDISEELSPLLPLLVTYFLWLDDEPDIAGTYLTEYEKLSTRIRRIEGRGTAPYIDVNRWS